jgi:TolB protein
VTGPARDPLRTRLARLREAADGLDLADPFDRVRARRGRLRLARRVRVAALVVGVLAATAGATWLAVRSFHRPAPRPATPSGNGLIAFTSSVTGTNDVWVVRANGTGRRDLTPSPTNDFGPAWSPDGRRIAFSKWEGPSGNRGIFVMDADGEGLRQLSHGSDFGAAWSPDGRLIAFSRGGGIWVMDAGGGDERELTKSPGGDRDPTWSPDGERLAFSRAMRAIFIVGSDGTALHQLTDGGSDVQPAWSPGGSLIVFQRHDALFVMRPDGTGIRQLTSGRSAVQSQEPNWSPDGRFIVFQLVEGGTQTVAVMNADGSGLRSLGVPGGGAIGTTPSWQAIPPR